MPTPPPWASREWHLRWAMDYRGPFDPRRPVMSDNFGPIRVVADKSGLAVSEVWKDGAWVRGGSLLDAAPGYARYMSDGELEVLRIVYPWPEPADPGTGSSAGA